MRVLGVGIATVDVVNRVARYPGEDEEVRALAQRVSRGGNATNTLVVLAQLGHRCRWAGVLGDDASSRIIESDLARCGVGSADCVRHPGGTTPTSYVVLSAANGSRTIVHFRDLPEFAAADFQRLPLEDLDWVHFEGRNPAETAAMLKRLKQERPGLRVSLELEKPRRGLERLLQGPDVLLISRAYVQARQAASPEDTMRSMLRDSSAHVCLLAWGSEGGYAMERGGGFFVSPAFPPGRVLDTLGAGDVFNAAVIDALGRGLGTAQALERGCRLAGRKCGQIGLGGLLRATHGQPNR